MSEVVCPACGFSKSPVGARFCVNCGGTLPAPAGDSVVINSNLQVGTVQGGQVTGVKIEKIIGTVIFGADDEVRARERRNLRVLLNKVKEFWVDGVLTTSLGGIAPLELEKRLAPDAVAPPLLELALVPGLELPPEAPIQQAFDLLERSLLIMDGAGSGKTTTLLKLAQSTAERAGTDPEQPIPVVLNLASWAQGQIPIAEWIVAELSLRYQIPAEMGRKWLKEQRLSLLMDGLDEVGSENIQSCIVALNEFRKEYGLLPLSVSVRTDDYTSARMALQLSGALALQPLSDAQIKSYLAACGPQGGTLETLLAEDEELRSLATSPLMLNVMRQAFEGVSFDELKSEKFDTLEERRDWLIQRYLERIFTRADLSHKMEYPRAKVIQRLGWLAQRMQAQRQAIFLVEQIQPQWLGSPVLGWLYWLGSRGLVSLLIGIMIGGTAEVAGSPRGRIAYLVASLLAGLLVGAAEAIRAGMGTGERFNLRLYSRAIWTAIATLIPGLCYFAVFGLGMHMGQDAWRLSIGSAAAFGLLLGRGGARQPGVDVQPVEALSWSTRGALRGILPGVGVLAATVAVIGAIFAWSNSLAIWLKYGVVYGLLGLVAMVLIYGLRGRTVEQHSYPNQGAWLSWRNAARAGLLIGGAAWLGYGLAYGLLPGLVVGLRVSLLAGLLYGAFDGFKAGLLRLLLAASWQMPFRTVKFLDYVVRLGLLQKVGGGYRFSSRLLQEYLAHACDDPKSS